MRRIYLLSVLLIGGTACDGVEDATVADDAEMYAEESEANAPSGELASEEAEGEPRKSEQNDDVNGALPEPVGDVLNGGGYVRSSCSCYTTCSSNGTGWTHTYYVGPASGQSNCSGKAASFCKGKSSTYKYHNSACT